MNKIYKNFMKNKTSSTSIEYGLVALLLSTVAGVSLGYSGDAIQGGVCSLSAKYNSAVYGYEEWDCSNAEVLASWIAGDMPAGSGGASSTGDTGGDTPTSPPYVGTPDLPPSWSEVAGSSFTGTSPLYATWNEFNLFGSPTSRYQLTAESPYLEQTYALRPASTVDCSIPAEDYCFVGLRTVDIDTSNPNYDGSPIFIGGYSGQQVGFIYSYGHIANLINNNASVGEAHFSLLTNNSYFNPYIAGNMYSGFTAKTIRLDANGNTSYVLNNSTNRGQNKFKLEDGEFHISYPFVVNGSLYNALYNMGSDYGFYHLIPSGGSTTYLYNEGSNKNITNEKYQIELISGWTASCERVAEGDDTLVMTETSTGTTATFIFVGRQTFDPLNPACDPLDATTFIQ